MEIDLERPVALNSSVVAVEVDGDLVMLDANSGNYYGVSGVARFVWEILQRSSYSGNAIVGAILDEYRIDKATCSDDVKLFMSELLDRGLVAYCD